MSERWGQLGWKAEREREQRENLHSARLLRVFEQSARRVPENSNRRLIRHYDIASLERAWYYNHNTEWVLRGEGQAFVKWYGPQVLIHNNIVYRRGAGHSWVPVEQGDTELDRQISDAFLKKYGGHGDRLHTYMWESHDWPTLLHDGRFTLIGKNVADNPYGWPGREMPALVPNNWMDAHTRDDIWRQQKNNKDADRMAEYLINYLQADAWNSSSGIHHFGIEWWRDPDDYRCDKVSIDCDDFSIAWPLDMTINNFPERYKTWIEQRAQRAARAQSQ